MVPIVFMPLPVVVIVVSIVIVISWTFGSSPAYNW